MVCLAGGAWLGTCCIWLRTRDANDATLTSTATWPRCEKTSRLSVGRGPYTAAITCRRKCQNRWSIQALQSRHYCAAQMASYLHQLLYDNLLSCNKITVQGATPPSGFSRSLQHFSGCNKREITIIHVHPLQMKPRDCLKGDYLCFADLKVR